MASASGTIEEGETYDENIVHEIEEEIGFNVLWRWYAFGHGLLLLLNLVWQFMQKKLGVSKLSQTQKIKKRGGLRFFIEEFHAK